MQTSELDVALKLPVWALFYRWMTSGNKCFGGLIKDVPHFRSWDLCCSGSDIAKSVVFWGYAIRDFAANSDSPMDASAGGDNRRRAALGFSSTSRHHDDNESPRAAQPTSGRGHSPAISVPSVTVTILYRVGALSGRRK